VLSGRGFRVLRSATKGGGSGAEMTIRFTPEDERFMRRALALAARGRGSVEPNPMVGCVIVRAGQVVGEGWHRRFGGPHAEVHALREAGPQAKGATCYVTLEPCCHHGKTPPCTDALQASGVRRVVVAMRDPFPKVAGRGFRLLRGAGIEVVAGLSEREAAELNAPYLKLLRTGRPWVILKWAQSLDGRIATRSGDSQWISGERSRAWVHRLRGRVDGILVGRGTVLRDNPTLTCRLGRPRRQAVRLVLDRRLRTPLVSGIVRTAHRVPTMIVAERGEVDYRRAVALRKAGVEVVGICNGPGGLDLSELLDELGRRRWTNLLVEGGGQAIGSFVDAGLADEAYVFVSPRLIGGTTAVSAVGGLGPETMKTLPRVRCVRIGRSGEDLLYHLRFSER